MYQYAQGDHQAFAQLYNKHKGALYRYFVRQMGDRQLAEDLYQETWSRVIKAAENYQSKAKFTTWLYTIAHNLLVDHYRALKPVDNFSDKAEAEHELEALLESEELSPESHSEQQLKANILSGCIALLPQVQKEAFLLSMELGLTAAGIAEVVGAGMEATKSRIRYANQALKECVQRQWQEQ
ncbi:sigma-70 family RNA polymerase sigma factor [Shewanella sp. Isolate11]|uniref:sigma-70 family RNA polymerase sigma factor n=1 Tax=Shewanella sp. Isolate11 TaxID=2908530 RepID=UPI001EFC9F58|nr:sigma-70 family RNA polymerase sigma factor [Shewanella sp. Isolate11]MCG9697248.1 sigma-70 family RNA polymerase sigma factor [Shewanella sp. Isolate11]